MRNDQFYGDSRETLPQKTVKTIGSCESAVDRISLLAGAHIHVFDSLKLHKTIFCSASHCNGLSTVRLFIKTYHMIIHLQHGRISI